jgi:hypothetical protein
MKVASWEVVSKKAYWDRNVSLEKWREKVIEGHMSYLPDAVATLSPLEFIHFLGANEFKLNWVKMRAKLPLGFLKHTGVYDIVWSKLISGGWNLAPSADFYNLPKRKRAFLIEVAKTQGKSIYEIAKTLNMQYRRAHDNAKSLIQSNKIKSIEVVENGHRKFKLYPAKG